MVSQLPDQWGVVITMANGTRAERTSSELRKSVFFKDGYVLWGPFPISLGTTMQIGCELLDHMDSGFASRMVEKRLQVGWTVSQGRAGLWCHWHPLQRVINSCVKAIVMASVTAIG